ncbi:hypothetical protein [Ferdinandcohnia sp. SAFN-114]|uniref:hypothetical protein n=1 Tax=Ferdinandcohnia sp. SAFN-114 TaxID=3387275 RepID=UPI003F7EBEB1
MKKASILLLSLSLIFSIFLINPKESLAATSSFDVTIPRDIFGRNVTYLGSYAVPAYSSMSILVTSSAGYDVEVSVDGGPWTKVSPKSLKNIYYNNYSYIRPVPIYIRHHVQLTSVRVTGYIYH